MTPKSWPLLPIGIWTTKRKTNPITGAPTKHTYDASVFSLSSLGKALRWLDKNGYSYLIAEKSDVHFKISFWQD